MNYIVGIREDKPPIFIRNPRLNSNQYWYLSVVGARAMAQALLDAVQFVEDGPVFDPIAIDNE